MKMITKLLLALFVVGAITYLHPGCVQAEWSVRMEGFGEGSHPGIMFYSPLDIGPMSPAIGWMSKEPLKDVSVEGATYVLTWDVTMAHLEEGNGYFVRGGSDFEDWDPTFAVGGILGASDWLSFEFFYKWGYVKNTQELEYYEGFQGGPGLGVTGSF